MLIRFIAMPSERARELRNGGLDDYGMQPERRTSDGPGHPCRHCLKNVDAGHDYLVFAYRPFPALQPYAETGPVFLHAEECGRAPEIDVIPELFRATPDYILRGYGHDDRIVYGTGAVTSTHQICNRSHELLERDDIAYLHMRSAKNNCFQVRIERAG